MRRKESQQVFFPTWVSIFSHASYFSRTELAKSVLRNKEYLGGKLLDVGCGESPYRHILAPKEYIGLEVSTNESSRRKDVIYYDGLTFPFPDNTVDSIICTEVLEHVFEPDRFISELFRVLRPSGYALLTFPFLWEEHSQPFDYARYSHFGAEHLFHRHGFKIISFERTCPDFRAICQLAASFWFGFCEHKIRKVSYKISRVCLYPVLLILNLTGICTMFLKNDALYLDNIFVLQKPLSYKIRS